MLEGGSDLSALPPVSPSPLSSKVPLVSYTFLLPFSEYKKSSLRQAWRELPSLWDWRELTSVWLGVGVGGLFGELPILEASVQGPVLAPQADYTSAFPLCLFSVFALI